ncbi:dTDP-4-dehydrorhamnose reductase [subsurface metagenome]|nr:dTDP-4-dehydrorhamnose reductase [Clostridia bacterium]
MKILITGSKGQLGIELIDIAPQEHKIFGYDLDMDITDRFAIESRFLKVKPDLVIHCAAFTDVDGCEGFRDKAFLVNGTGTENLAKVARKYDCEFVYVSTDYVFNGKKDMPYVEEDIPDPVSIYGKSKLAGEEAVTNILEKFYILRTTGIYSRYGKNFVETIIRASENCREIEVVDDQVCTPTYSLDVAECIYKLIETGMYGIYHATNDGQCSWYQFTKEIFKILGKRVTVIPVKSGRLGGRASRPSYSVLANLKLEKNKIYFMRHWKEALKGFLESCRING